MRSGGLRSAARAAARRGDWLSASRHYDALVLTRGARAGDRVQLGHARKELGDENAALAAYADAANRHPLHLDAQRQYGFFLRRMGRDAAARDVLARALAIDPDARDIAAEIADLGVTDAETLDRHFLRGILGGADANAGGGESLIARWLAAWSLGRARSNARARDWPAAEHHYRAVLRHMPDHKNARAQLGHALREQDRPAEALAAYRRALVASPRDPDLHLHVGHALKLLERRHSAFDAYLSAWRLKPGFTAAFDEIRGLAPQIDDPELLDGEIGLPENKTAGGTVVGGRRRLVAPVRLKGDPLSVFKYLAGAIVYKD